MKIYDEHFQWGISDNRLCIKSKSIRPLLRHLSSKLPGNRFIFLCRYCVLQYTWRTKTRIYFHTMSQRLLHEALCATNVIHAHPITHHAIHSHHPHSGLPPCGSLTGGIHFTAFAKSQNVSLWYGRKAFGQIWVYARVKLKHLNSNWTKCQMVSMDVAGRVQFYICTVTSHVCHCSGFNIDKTG